MILKLQNHESANELGRTVEAVRVMQPIRGPPSTLPLLFCRCVCVFVCFAAALPSIELWESEAKANVLKGSNSVVAELCEVLSCFPPFIAFHLLYCLCFYFFFFVISRSYILLFEVVGRGHDFHCGSLCIASAILCICALSCPLEPQPLFRTSTSSIIYPIRL